MENQSAVEFATDKRVHISLTVSDLAASAQFYENLLGIGPDKTRDDYMRFSVAEPPLNLSLTVGDDGPRFAGHLGIQVKSTDQVDAIMERIGGGGIETKSEEQQTCCYAVQNKVWVSDPDGTRWEVFVTTNDDAPREQNEGEPCCVGSSCC